MSLEPQWIWDELVDFIREVPQAFPAGEKSWSLALVAFFFHAGKESGFEVRCGDWAARWKEQTARTPEQAFPARYRHFAEQWKVTGLLEFDACWVSPGFHVLVGTPEQPVPAERNILLAFEHEDETYVAVRGTDVTKILDEVRKIAAVKANVKVLSFFSSKAETQRDNNLPLIQAEVARFRSSGMLTEQWIVLQFCQFEQGRNRLEENGSPELFIRGMLFNGDGTNPRLLAEATLPMPGSCGRSSQ